MWGQYVCMYGTSRYLPSALIPHRVAAAAVLNAVRSALRSSVLCHQVHSVVTR